MNVPEFIDPGKIISQIGITEGLFVSDFGCGSGHFSILMARAVGPNGRLAAVDVQTSALENVKEQAKRAGLDNVAFIHADLEVPGSTKLPDSSQDLVLMRNVLFQSQKKEQVMKEALRVLKTGSRLAVIEWKKGAGGFGPPDNIRTDEAEIETLIQNLGFGIQNKIGSDDYHFGFIAVKK
ncbi:MAG: hypothetical protein A3G02_01905 [Candidatus Yanofskybacteria bacterium RIFCSPLOWO2_12_FULL_44_13b]|uniref:Methylase involved in ubiquinone/menaquinone biosynthesis n=1 Tax=Candidatus Yanofskybacteria bacterium GW2011_GWB1_45_11 TaxID=1619026 RepID=A0A0G1L3E3_9BACT|nr:MAG: Methylase involved in ubiquinone/menaquinone biosynthesis [Candidatus Yanofskybacteria bacterium GW2011_GWB1_45_11]OGN03276.1 MAG: hypothetical protein A2657_00100 [Candidatus Yanofskybacteria bacterium RIFCSPHIGHO2_01_FULL_44_110b]OGN14917.1 MAG: hypothetical protein A3C01_02315 [Candidatus Yanofskybacteria bacterium RIFCSPHIGHO2_02_FULL_44_36b]OGN18423.1 MAG: hypothetical protein A3F50_01325 [Candidatus Yanofskybacteria bacterium RIFCSPHIGHO2_12_FULL_44_29b]OGN26818.1 MAG: hypothetica